MKQKLHLPARPANEGARLLARWIMREHGGCLRRTVRAHPGLSAVLIDRLVAGEVAPGQIVAQLVGEAAGIGHRAWRRPAAGGWFDPEMLRAA